MSLGRIELVTLFSKSGGWNASTTFFGNTIDRVGDSLVGLIFPNIVTQSVTGFHCRLIFNNGATFTELSGTEDQGTDWVHQLATIDTEKIVTFHKTNTLAPMEIPIMSTFQFRAGTFGATPGIGERLSCTGMFFRRHGVG